MHATASGTSDMMAGSLSLPTKVVYALAATALRRPRARELAMV